MSPWLVGYNHCLGSVEVILGGNSITDTTVKAYSQGGSLLPLLYALVNDLLEMLHDYGFMTQGYENDYQVFNGIKPNSLWCAMEGMMLTLFFRFSLYLYY